MILRPWREEIGARGIPGDSVEGARNGELPNPESGASLWFCVTMAAFETRKVWLSAEAEAQVVDNLCF